MALTVYTEPTNVATLTGSLVLIKDPQTADQPDVTGVRNLTVSNLASLGQLGGGVLSGGAGGSAVSLAAGGTVTIGSGVRVVRISVAAIAGAINMPTDSVDGRDITILNAGTAALTIVTNCGVSVAIASGASAGFVWDVASTLWYHKA